MVGGLPASSVDLRERKHVLIEPFGEEFLVLNPPFFPQTRVTACRKEVEGRSDVRGKRHCGNTYDNNDNNNNKHVCV